MRERYPAGRLRTLSLGVFCTSLALAFFGTGLVQAQTPARSALLAHAAVSLTAAANGIPVRVTAFAVIRSLFYLMAGPNVMSPAQLKGKAVGMNVFGSANEVAARVGLKHLGLDPARDVTLLALEPPSTRLAALTSGTVAAVVMPLPWNLRTRTEGFRQLLDISTLMDQPTTGIGATLDRVRKRPEEIKALLRGLLASLAA